MAKKISNKDIFDGNIFASTKEGAEQLNDELKKLISGFADLGKTVKNDLPKGQIETFKDLDKAAKDIGKVNAAFDGFTKAQKEQAKLQEKLAELKTEDAKQNEVTRLQIQQQKKANKELAKEQEGLIGSYQKLAKRLNDNRKRLKNLAAEGKTNTKEFKKLKKEVGSLDKELKEIDATAGQFQRNVGNYPDSLGDAAEALKGFAITALSVGAALETVNKGIQANEESSEEFRETTSQVGATFDVLLNRLGKTASSLFVFGSDVIRGKKELKDYDEVLDETLKTFDGAGEEIDKATSAAKDATIATIELEKAQRSLNISLAILNGEIEKQNQIAGDTTKSFNEQEEAARTAQKLQIERALILQGIAKEEVDILERQIKARGEGANVLELQNELSAKQVELIEINNELMLAQIDNEKVLREVQRDRFERELDFAIDAFDAQKTINERRIADDRKTIEERAAILNETIRLAESSFNSQKELFANFVSDKVDFDTLVKETDEAAIRRTLRRLDLDDVELGRALEVIKERKIALQDLDDAERDIDDAKTERRERRLDAEQNLEEEQFRNAIENQERLNSLEEDNFQLRLEGIEELFRLKEELIKDSAQFEKDQADVTAEELDAINQKLINDLAANERDKLDAVKDVNKKIVEDDKKTSEERLETAKHLLDLTSDAFDDAFDEREKALDDEIARREESVSLQQSRAEKGLENQLAFEKEQLAKAELERARLAEKRAKQEEAAALAQAFLNAFAARAKDDPDTAAAKALTDVILAKALSETVAGAFAEGVEDFQGKGTGTSDSNLIRFSHGESVVTAKGTKENQGLVTAMNNGDVGSWFANNMMLSPLSSEKNYDSFGILAQKIESIEKAIKNRPTSQTNLDNMGNVMQSTYRNGIKNTVKYINKPGVI